MRSKTVPLLALVATTVAMIVPSAATAAIFRGSTTEGEQATIRTDAEGVPTRFWLKKLRLACRGDSTYTDHGVGAIPPFDEATERKLIDRGPRIQIHDGRRRASLLAAVRANRVSPERWVGRYRASMKVFEAGDLVNRCKAKFRFTLDLTS